MIASFASPNSGLLDAISTLPLSIWNLTARDLSLDSSATRFTALVRRSRSNSTRLSLLFGMTRSNAGNCPSIIREISRRPPMSKNRWFSPRSYQMSPSPSASSRPISSSVLRGRMTRSSSSPLRPFTFSRGTEISARRCPSVATRLIASGFWMNSAPLRK